MHSVLISLDGPSKCGKTAVVSNLEKEAFYFRDEFIDTSAQTLGLDKNPETVKRLDILRQSISFYEVTTISAGDTFRAATQFVLDQKKSGNNKTSFTDEDADALMEVMTTYDSDHFQNDPEIAERVSDVGAMPGAPAVCKKLYADSVQEAYNRHQMNSTTGTNHGSLVIIDGRNPLTTLREFRKIGFEGHQILPVSVLPIYIDTPASIAASRMEGNYARNLEMIEKRRRLDRERSESPFIRPDNMLTDMWDWKLQFGKAEGLDFRLHELSEPVKELVFDNGSADMSNIQYFAGQMALFAQEISIKLTHQLKPVALN